MIKEYQNKPTRVIKAFRWDGKNSEEIIEHFGREKVAVTSDDVLMIKESNGDAWYTVNDLDYVAVTEAGNFPYSFNKEKFERSYEEVPVKCPDVLPLTSCNHEPKDQYVETRIQEGKVKISMCKSCQHEIMNNTFKFSSISMSAVPYQKEVKLK